MAALKRMAAPSATPSAMGSRHGSASELVPGDVVLLEAGQVIPALCACANVPT
jgi:magnesium-transporting ATPase (P-type)